ncbi:hypothetical protein N8385_01975 [Cyclobacteriaceae bacterium]|jgi:hypothetical protein|nr:hypothetical protein [Cyclobacteriaceae bacterium]|tara:strand:+ start:20 stop:592 length:573 start_codon:yes stop_codon:yes gene_type:complete
MSSFDFQEIPKIFYSYQTQKPFSNCLVCSCYLLEDQTYIIEKALKKHPGFTAQDVIFDYAICLSCALKMRQEFSKESLEKINAYFAEHVDMNPLPPQDAPIDLDEALSQCVVKKIPLDEIANYQIYAHCQGNKLIKSIPPYLISQSAIEDLIPLISSDTQDILNGFYDRFLRPDPAMLLPKQPSDQLVFI